MPLPKISAPIDPFVELVSRCEAQGAEYAARVETIRRNAGDFWAVPRMPWFTQHGTEHSDSLVRLLGETIEHLQASPRQCLNCGELYVLLAACYLHDVGMQVIKRKWDELDRTAHERIRLSHPRIGRKLIIKRTKERLRGEFDPGLADDDFLLPIGLVSEAHGTQSYAGAVTSLIKMRPDPLGVSLRGDLLAAILLMLDELDVRRSRATFPKEAKLSTISMAHHLMNHYVSGIHVKDGETAKERRIHVNFLFPPNDRGFNSDVRELIVTKLLRQSRLTNPVVSKRTNGEMRWDTKVEVYEAEDTFNALRRPDPLTRRFFLVEVLEKRLIGRRSELRSLRTHLEEMRGSRLTIDLITFEQGGEEVPLIFRWLSAVAADLGYEPIHLAPSIIQAGHGERGLIEHVARQLGFDRTSDAVSLSAEIASSAQRPLLMVEDIGAISGDARRTIEVLSKEMPGVVIVSGSEASGLASAAVNLGLISEEAIRAHLAGSLGYSAEEARHRARALYAASRGFPGPLVLSLFAEFEAAVVEAIE